MLGECHALVLHTIPRGIILGPTLFADGYNPSDLEFASCAKGIKYMFHPKELIEKSIHVCRIPHLWQLKDNLRQLLISNAILRVVVGSLACFRRFHLYSLYSYDNLNFQPKVKFSIPHF